MRNMSLFGSYGSSHRNSRNGSGGKSMADSNDWRKDIQLYPHNSSVHNRCIFPPFAFYFQIEIQTTTILLRAIITATMTMPVLPMARTSIPTHFLQSTLQNQIMALRPTAILIALRLRGRNEAPPHRFVSTMSPRRPFFASERNGLTRRKVSPWNLPWSMASWVIYPFFTALCAVGSFMSLQHSCADEVESRSWGS